MNNQDALGDEQVWVKCPDCRTTWDTKLQPHNECPVCGKPTSLPLGRQEPDPRNGFLVEITMHTDDARQKLASPEDVRHRVGFALEANSELEEEIDFTIVVTRAANPDEEMRIIDETIETIGMFGQYYRYPLRTQPMQKWTDKEFTMLPGDSVVMTTLVFRMCNPRYASVEDYNARKPPIIEWECMACAEAGNEWIGQDPRPHCEAHQMGFDYAVTFLEKQKRGTHDTPK